MRTVPVILILTPFLALMPLRAEAQSQTFTLSEDREWVLESAPEPNTDEALISEARRLVADGSPDRAERNLTQWLDANKRTENPLRGEALLARADARTAQGREYAALFDYEEVIRRYPGSTSFARAVERELEIGIQYVNGLPRHFLGIRWLDATDIGIELLIRTQERLPGGQLAERAAITLADHYYATRQVELAAQAYELYVMNFPQGPHVRKAAQRRIFADIARFKGPEYDTSGLLDAQVRIRQFARDYPAEAERTGLNQALINRLDDSLGANLLDSAQWYLRTGKDSAAKHVLTRLVSAYPRSGAAQRALAIAEEKGWDITPVAETAEPAEDAAPIRIEGPVQAEPEPTPSSEPSP